MINSHELEISNKSYINKDFQKLYPEILELARKLSAKWDPSTSNESDPGVVLLKMLGFTGDGLIYNSDKNALEAFMPSATQENSMRNLCEMNGYFPRYYQSATVTVSFMYVGDKLTDDTKSFKLKALETTITNADGDITYTLKTDAVINERYKTVTASAIEGKLQTLLINNVEDIHLNNLDDNNRVYFPEKQVAENGIFIQSLSDTSYYWDKVDNLNTTEPGQFVYKFGYDSVSGLPYIEFPNDISSLIEEGVTIRYIRTTGSSGNVKSGVLTVMSSPSQVALTDEPSIIVYPDTTDNESEKTALLINNVSESINGMNPESIDEAYNSFKKVVGTFDTLVTSRDYANAIYNLQTSDNKDVVSNIQVADRRTDINYANNILSFNQYGIQKINDTDSAVITPFELCLYPLNPIVTSYTDITYKNSFKPLFDLVEVESGIEDFKTISHDYKTLSSSDIYMFKNYYTINAKITTNYKVNTFEQKAILANINDALYRSFNARELDFGSEIPFDTLLETIRGADSRIKNVSLDEPTIKAYVMNALGGETALTDGTKAYYIDLMAKNILAGRTSLFDYNIDFDFEFGQTAFPIANSGSGDPVESDFIHEKLVSVTTQVTISAAGPGGTGYTEGYILKKNEYVQVIAPSLVTEITYPAYVNYRWSGSSVPANEEHPITGAEYLIVNYTDSNDISIAIKYTADKIITYKVSKTKESGEDYYTSVISSTVNVTAGSNIFKPNFLLTTPTEASLTTKKIEFDFDVMALAFYSLGASETLEKRKFVQTTLTSKSLPCYWIMNNRDNALFTGSYDAGLGGYQTVLGENEYFMYSNSSLTELEVLGSGTRLTLTCLVSEDLDKWKIVPEEDKEEIKISDVSDKGLAAFETYNWKYKNFDSTYNLKIEETTILTLTEKDLIKIGAGFTDSITNVWADVTLSAGEKISYIISGEGVSTDLPTYTGITWKIRSRLDLNTGPDLKQELLENQSITMKLYISGDVAAPITKTRVFNTSGKFIVFNTLIQQAGGVDLDMLVSYLDGSTGYDVNAYTFDFVEPTYTETSGSIVTVERGTTGYSQVILKDLETSPEGLATIDLPIVSYYDSGTHTMGSGKTELLMVYWNHVSSLTNVTGVSIDATATGGKGIRFYNSGDGWNTSLTLVNGINIIEINSTTKLTLNITYPSTGTDTLQLGRISVTTGYNSALKLDATTEVEQAVTGLLALIADADSNNKFYYNGTLDSQSLIEYNDLSDARALFDYNNIANKFTICQIDFENSLIEIVRTSKV